MSFWTILDDDGEVVAACVESEETPDPADYGGTAVEELTGHLDAACAVRVDGAWHPDLSRIRLAMIDAANALADASADKYITPGARQAMTYLRKESEARAYMAGDPAGAFITEEAARTGMTVQELVDMIIGNADAWTAIGAAIEARRRELIVAIEAAETREDIDAIDVTVGWP